MAEIRGAAPEELESVVELCNRVFRPGGGDMGAQYPLLFHPDNAERVRTAWLDGQVVSHAGYVRRDAWILGAAISTASVGAVCTDPSHRGQGFASQVMQDLEDSARSEECDLLLVSGDRKLYRTMGCVRAGQFQSFSLEAAPTPLRDLTVRPAREEDAGTLVGLHQTSPVRFERSVDDWIMMLDCGMLMNQPADTYVVEIAGLPAAYVGVQRTEGEGGRRVMEYGGSTAAVWHSLSGIGSNGSPLEILQMPGDPDLPILARGAARQKARGFAGTVKILDPGAFLEKFQVVLAERLSNEEANDLLISPDGETITFEWAGQVADVPETELARLVFGPAPGEDPYPLSEGPLQEILDRILPVPLVWYGYNYI